ncbi:AAA family ATPase [Bacillus lacus]|uniref:AAA family ATPase n=1 Tax=Metabacillus lacus TaxID=1983721 RepID=A0A7X2IY66_9BACI|nr:TniB family NTP-binding protein [Metabacillus lacus]MRX71970.1 AAA family ATPase [Metabacillus lacus]
MQTDTREKYSSMDLVQKKEQIRNLRIAHPRFKKALDLIKRCHDSSSISDDPRCMLITGPSGSGKSTIFETYRQFNDKIIYESTRTKRVVLWAEIPSPTRISTFLETMLEQLGDPAPTRGTIGNKNHRLVNLIKDCRVELIMLDEFQHFVNTENQKVNYEVADCFKSLINRTKVPVVLFGLDDAKTVLECNPQLKRRFSMRYSIPPFGYEEENRKKEFRMLMKQLDNLLPFEQLAGLENPEFADRIMTATGGVMNSIMKLIKEAALIALEQEKEQIEMIDMAKAYQLHSYILLGEENNPFVKKDFKLTS